MHTFQFQFSSFLAVLKAVHFPLSVLYINHITGVYSLALPTSLLPCIVNFAYDKWWLKIVVFNVIYFFAMPCYMYACDLLQFSTFQIIFAYSLYPKQIHSSASEKRTKWTEKIENKRTNQQIIPRFNPLLKKNKTRGKKAIIKKWKMP